MIKTDIILISYTGTPSNCDNTGAKMRPITKRIHVCHNCWLCTVQLRKSPCPYYLIPTFLV